ncbi:MAG: 4-hydroxybenzoate octaprenyltransferase [Hyphomicrobiales bacterium]
MNDANDTQKSVADAIRGHWVDTRAPDWLKPYARLARWDRPIGWWLLLLPCWWSVALAANSAGTTINPWYLFLFFVGAVAMRGAGCTYNDFIDRDIDAQVARTKSRPLPSGQVTVLQVQFFIAIQALIGLVVLLQFNNFAIVLGFLSLPIIAIYPFMKRISNWPQVVLGFAFSWGALMGFAVTFGELTQVAPFFIYAGAILWTVGYDTIYAHQDQEDDAIIGVKSTARTFGDNSQLLIGSFFGGAILMIAIGIFSAGGGVASALGLAVFATHLGWQVASLQTDNPDRCLMQFRSNRNAGLLLFAGLALDTLM